MWVWLNTKCLGVVEHKMFVPERAKKKWGHFGHLCFGTYGEYIDEVGELVDKKGGFGD